MSDVYKKAGVDTVAGQHFVDLIKPAVRSTQSSHVIGGLGGFSALFDASFLKHYDAPVLVSSTDGVGTKLTLAKLFDRHETVGIDLVAMCANDLLVCGAKPLFFLDYIAVGRLDPEQMKTVVSSIAAGCRLAHCSLVGGETAEHPNVMPDDEYDLAGFVVGVVEKEKLQKIQSAKAGDVIIGIPSSGIHSNGVSLVRRLFLENQKLPASEKEQSFLRDEILLTPTILYEEIVRPMIDQDLPTAMVHVTGGGFFENVPRVLSDSVAAKFTSWQLPEPFATIQKRGNLSTEEMLHIFNCGYGYLMIVSKENANRALLQINEEFRKYRNRLQTEIQSMFGSSVSLQNTESFQRPAAIIGTIITKEEGQSAVQFVD